MDFIVDSDQKECPKECGDQKPDVRDGVKNSLIHPLFTEELEEANPVDFSFITDEDDGENVLDSEDTDESEDEKKEDSTVPKTKATKNTEVDTKAHPLAHLFDLPDPTETKQVTNKSKKRTRETPLIEKLYDGLTKKCKKTIRAINKTYKEDEVDKLLAKSELLNSDPSEMFRIQPQISKRKLKKMKKEEAEKTKGGKWYGLPATEMTDEVKRDLELLKMRSVLDPKRFYKKNDIQELPKYFHIGKIMDSPRDFYSHRLTKKERKKTLVDELMADADFNRYNKNKYAEILKEKKKTHYKAWRQSKRLKKN